MHEQHQGQDFTPAYEAGLSEESLKALHDTFGPARNEVGSGRHRKAWDPAAEATAGAQALANHQARLVARVKELPAGGSIDISQPHGRHAKPRTQDEFELAAHYTGPGRPREEHSENSGPNRIVEPPRVERATPSRRGVDRVIPSEVSPTSIVTTTSQAVRLPGTFPISPRIAAPAEDQTQEDTPAAEPVPLNPPTIGVRQTGSTNPSHALVLPPHFVSPAQSPAQPTDDPLETEADAFKAHPTVRPGNAEASTDTSADAIEPPHNFTVPLLPADASRVVGGIAGRARPANSRASRPINASSTTEQPPLVSPYEGDDDEAPDALWSVPLVAERGSRPESAVDELAARLGMEIEDGTVYRHDSTTGSRAPVGDATKPGIRRLMRFQDAVATEAARRVHADPRIDLLVARGEAIDAMDSQAVNDVLRAMAENMGAEFSDNPGQVSLPTGKPLPLNLWVPRSNSAKIKVVREALEKLTGGGTSPEDSTLAPAATPAAPPEALPDTDSDTTDDDADPNSKWWLDPELQDAGAPSSSNAAGSTPTPPTGGRHRAPGRARRFYERNRLAVIAGASLFIGAVALGWGALDPSGSHESPNEYRSPAAPAPEHVRPTTATTAPAPATSAPAAPVETKPPVTPPPAQPSQPTAPTQPGTQPRAEVQNPLDTIRFTTDSGQKVTAAIVKTLENGTTSNAIYDTLEAVNPTTTGNLATTYELVNDLEDQGFKVDQINPGQEFEITFDADGKPVAIAAK